MASSVAVPISVGPGARGIVGKAAVAVLGQSDGEAERRGKVPFQRGAVGGEIERNAV